MFMQACPNGLYPDDALVMHNEKPGHQSLHVSLAFRPWDHPAPEFKRRMVIVTGCQDRATAKWFVYQQCKRIQNMHHMNRTPSSSDTSGTSDGVESEEGEWAM